MRLVRAVSFLYCAVVAATLLAGLCLFAASFVPFGTVRAVADSLSPDGSAEMLTGDVHRKLVFALRLLGAALLAGGAVAWWLRRGIPERFAADLAMLGGPARAERSSLVGLLLITVAAAVLRGIFLNQPMGWDESYSYLAFIGRPLPVTVSAYTDPNNHVFHSLLAKFAVMLLGVEPWVIRLPAFLGGVLAIPGTYAVGRVLFNRHAGLLAAGLVACSSYHIEYSTNARGYTLQALFTLASVALAVAFRGRRNTAAWGAFTLLAALGFWTLPTMLYPFLGILLWLFAVELLSPTRADGQGTRAHNFLWYAAVASLTGALTLLLYAPVLSTVGPEALVANDYVRPLPHREFWSGLPGLLIETWEHWNRDVPAPISSSLLLAAIVSLGIPLRERQKAAAIPAIFAASFVLIAVQRVLPFPRVWLFLLPLFVIQASAGLCWIAGRLVQGRPLPPLIAVLAILLCGPTAYFVVRHYPVLRSPETGVLPDAKAVAAFLEGYVRPGERVLAPVPSSTQLQFYFQKDAPAPESLISNEPGDLPEDRVIVVVNKLAGQALPQMLNEHGLDADPGSAQVLREYPSALVYEVRREP